MHEDSRVENALRLTLLNRLFRALDLEADEERIAAWADAARGLSADQLELRCRTLAREWSKDRAPRPADLLAAVPAAAGAGVSGRTTASMWIDGGVHRKTGERVLGEDEIMARYRRLGTPMLGDASDEAQAIRRGRRPSNADEVPF